MKIKIKHRINGMVLFSLETTSLRLAVEAAIKSSVDLSYADLRSADLRSADLSYADLRSADLRSADLSYANLSYADLRSADLRSADLRYADLRYADLSYADLSYADLSYADLRYADLRYAGGINKYLTTDLYLLLEQTGKIRAYKLVNSRNEGPYNGGIIYEIGESYTVNNFNSDENDKCGEGINLATLGWCLQYWESGYKILVAEFTKKDIVCIPIGSDGKFRVKSCKIIKEIPKYKYGALIKKD